MSMTSAESVSAWYPATGEKWPPPVCCSARRENATTRIDAAAPPSRAGRARLVARTTSRNASSDASDAYVSDVLAPWQRASAANSRSDMPALRTSASGLQHPSICSVHQRHGFIHVRPGSTPSALSATASADGPQNAGSACICAFSASAQNGSSVPARSARSKRRRPSADENATSAPDSGNGRR